MCFLAVLKYYNPTKLLNYNNNDCFAASVAAVSAGMYIYCKGTLKCCVFPCYFRKYMVVSNCILRVACPYYHRKQVSKAHCDVLPGC
jgi:hypothetical protein